MDQKRQKLKREQLSDAEEEKGVPKKRRGPPKKKAKVAEADETHLAEAVKDQKSKAVAAAPTAASTASIASAPMAPPFVRSTGSKVATCGNIW